LISNYHVIKDAAKVRLLTSTGIIDATVVKVDATNDLALLKAAGRFAPLPVAASRGVNLGGTVMTIGFPDIGLQGFAPKLAKGEIASLSGAADTRAIFKSAWRCSRAIRAGCWWMNGVTSSASCRPRCWRTATVCVGGFGRIGFVAGKCQLRGQEQFSVELPRIRAGRGKQVESAGHG
jgi:hypothetical protein